MNRSRILLEAGTNELEIMVMEIGALVFGVNVAKVREVILPVRVHALPSAPPFVEGVFELRGSVVELLDLRSYLGLASHLRDSQGDSQIIVTEFNESMMGFRIDRVLGIERASWDQIQSVPEDLQGGGTPIVGIAQVKDQIVQMLDLELILSQVKPGAAWDAAPIEAREERTRARILVADDSDAIRARIVSTLRAAGYTDLTEFRSGAEVWEHIEACSPDNDPDLVVTDIEMPQLDGLHLTKKIRGHHRLADIPVILFSSLVNDRTRHKGEQVGATAQISKPQLPQAVELMDRLLGIESVAR
ncbi:MAG: chemotaxis protein [Planctomycetota bacterium]